MKDKKVLKFPNLISEKTEEEIIFYYCSKLEEAILAHDVYTDHRLEQALIHLQNFILWWEFYCAEE